MKKQIAVIILICFSFFQRDIYSKELTPKEHGLYVMAESGLKRLLPNMVFEEEGIYFIEMLKPSRFTLKEIEYFVLYGRYNIDLCTINPLLPLGKSALGKDRFMFGKELKVEIKKIGDDLYTIRPKDLLGRGYFSIWIENIAWDFIIE